MWLPLLEISYISVSRTGLWMKTGRDQKEGKDLEKGVLELQLENEWMGICLSR